jgi:predicted nucleic acid-binding protein
LILIDTTPLVALCDPRDGLHRRALRDLARVKLEPIVVCEAILTEACFLLPHAVQRQRLFRLLRELPVRDFTGERDPVWPAVSDWLEKYADHGPDWADASPVVLASQTKSAKVWTYDTEFWTTWRGPDGKRVSLFVDPRK